MCAAVYRQRHLVKATEVTAGLAESNGSLLPGLWHDSLHVTCGLTACTPGSAPGPTLGNKYGKTLPYLWISQNGVLLLMATFQGTDEPENCQLQTYGVTVDVGVGFDHGWTLTTPIESMVTFIIFRHCMCDKLNILVAISKGIWTTVKLCCCSSNCQLTQVDLYK